MRAFFKPSRRWKTLRSPKRAQTLLEYFLLIAVFVIPTAVAFNSLLKDSDENKKDNLVRRIGKDAYGAEDQMGAIGRPYP
jgi:hypothetical protein